MKDIIVLCLLLIVGIIFLIFGVRFLLQSQGLSRVGVKTSGKVISYDAQSDLVSPGKSAGWSKQVQFVTQGGQTITFHSKIGWLPKNIVQNDSVPVLYDPEHPENAIIDTFSERSMLWIILLSVGAIFVLLAGGVFFFTRSSCEKNAATTYEMNKCTGEKYEKSQAELQAQVEKARKNMSQDARVSFDEEQKIWEATMRRKCTEETASSVGGSIHLMELNICYTIATEQRIRDITNNAH